MIVEWRHLKSKSHACIGISPFNSLFSVEYLTKTINFAKNNFESFHLFVPDNPTIYTLLALGYCPEKAEAKLKKQINWLRNKITKALLLNGISENNHMKYILDFKTLRENKLFNQELTKVEDLFQSDSVFREQCLSASYWVLENKMDKSHIRRDNLELAVKYFLFELPLFGSTDRILNKVESVFCYHQTIDFLKLFYNKKLSYRASENQFYMVIDLFKVIPDSQVELRRPLEGFEHLKIKH